MFDDRLSEQLQPHRTRQPVFWQKISITPYPKLISSGKSNRSESEDLPARLDTMLSKRRKKLPDTVAIGWSSDPYPNIEKKERLTHRCLEVLAKHGSPILLSTGSSLILRDIDLLREIHLDSMVTVGLEVPVRVLSSKGNRPETAILQEWKSMLERISRSGLQTGLIIDSPNDRLTPESLSFVFETAAELRLDFVYFRHQQKLKTSKNVAISEGIGKKSGKLPTRLSPKLLKIHLRAQILQLSDHYNMRLLPKRYMPNDLRRENFWLAETLANQAYLLELSGKKARGHWAAARKIDSFDGDIRLWALRGELADMTTTDPLVRTDLERFLRGETSSNREAKLS